MLDLIIRNARSIDGQKFEIGIEDGKLSMIDKKITVSARKEYSLAEDEYLSAGWIDDHVHCFEEMSLYYDYPDQIGVEKGVTTVIDAGTTGAENIGRFYKLAQQAKTNVFALVNISKWGIVEQDELADLTKIQADLVHQVVKEMPDFIVGLKARMSKTVIGANGITPLELAKKIQKENQNLPLMVHIGSAPPDLAEILELLEKGDVLTHCFNGKSNGIFDAEKNKIKEFVWRAYNKGVVFDIGHGTDSFNFKVAKEALKEKMLAHSISTDIYIRNRKNGPVYDMATTMEKLRAVGYSWQQIIERVTIGPAKNFHLENKGRLSVGCDADLTIFKFAHEQKQLQDSNGNIYSAAEQILPVKTIIGGSLYDNQL